MTPRARLIGHIARDVDEIARQLLRNRNAFDAAALARQAADAKAAPRQLERNGSADAAARTGNRDRFHCRFSRATQRHACG